MALLPLALLLTFFALQAILAQAAGTGPAADLAFPLRDGTFYVLQGGRHPWVNRYAGEDSTRGAVELARLGSIGRLDVDSRPFVYSPVAGVVSKVKRVSSGADGGSKLDASGEGAAIWITVSDSAAVPRVVELRPVFDRAVEAGDTVQIGTRLGQLNAPVGEAPSVVVMARQGAVPLGIRFGGYYLARNALFHAPPGGSGGGPGTSG